MSTTDADTAPPEPVLHCYMREHLFMTPNEATVVRAQLVAFAEREGYRLGKIFIEKVESVPQAFGVMVRALIRQEAAAIAVPSLHHFKVIGEPDHIKAEIERVTGVRVLLADHVP